MESLERRDRRVIPRWRPFEATARLGELSTSGQLLPVPGGIEDRLAEWAEHRTLWHAADLIGSAIVTGREAEVIEASMSVLSDASAPIGAHVLAERSIAGLNALGESPEVIRPADILRVAYSEIRRQRLRLRDDPRNAIAWVELSRAYVIAGEESKAVRAIERALILAPENRFVVRSASRLFVHQHDLARAQELLRLSPFVSVDPWLLAAEIAVANASGRTSRLIRGARGMLKRENRKAHEVSELASALASVELDAGNNRLATKWFRESLREPTENSVAQAVWAAPKLPSFTVDPASYDVPRRFEALASKAFHGGDWDGAWRCSQSWLGDEPFSSRPAVFGSFVAAMLLEDWQKAAEVARFGLKRNPGDVSLLNNLAFALTQQGQLEDAEAVMQKAAVLAPPSTALIAISATSGLIRFRRGDPVAGEGLYLEAIQMARQQGLADYEAMASIFLALEELRLGRPAAASSVERAREAAYGRPEAHIKELLTRLERESFASQAGGPAGSSSP